MWRKRINDGTSMMVELRHTHEHQLPTWANQRAEDQVRWTEVDVKAQWARAVSRHGCLF